MKIKRRLSNNIKWKLEERILFLSIVFQNSSTLFFLPINLTQVLILIMLFILIIRSIVIEKSFKIPYNYLILIGYIFVITIFNVNDIESIKSFGYFSLHILAICMYFNSKKSYLPLYSVIYNSAMIIAVYGIIQEIAYVLNIPQLYDITLYGFPRNGTYETTFGLLRAMSLYAEPSHTAFIIAFAIYVSMISLKYKLNISTKKGLIILFVFSFFTISFIVWMCVATAVVIFMFFLQKGAFKKIKWISICTLLFLIVININTTVSSYIFDKLDQFKTLSTTTGNDLSALAIVTNFEVAVEKMKDGYLFGTGLDSHRLYYFEYINKLYSSLILYLNNEDAASMYTRVFSEFGIVGITIFISIIIYKFIQAKSKNDICMISIVILYIVFISRNGQYISLITSMMFVVIFLLPRNKHKELSSFYNNIN